MKNYSISLAVLGILAAGLSYAQGASKFSGAANANSFAYGYNNITPLSVGIGTTATGAGTITLAYGNIVTTDGITVMPFSTTAPIIVGVGSNAETVTPSAVSCSTPAVYNTCQVTATFSNIHGIGDLVTSGTFGLVEAINYTHTLGGLVIFDGKWLQNGGARASLTGYHGFQNVTVLDWAGTPNATTSGDGKSYISSTNGAVLAANVVLY